MAELSNDYMLIDGRLVNGRSEVQIEVEDPTNLESVGKVPSATVADVDVAVKSARQALDSGPWGKMTVGERERLILKLADLVERDRVMLAEIEAVETGRTVGNALAFDSDLSVSCLRYMAGWATKITGKTTGV